MQDTGQKWIGLIPKEWKSNKIGQLFNLRNAKVSDKAYSPLSVSKLGVVSQMESVAKSDASDDRKLVLKGDFAINSRSDRKQSCGVSPYDGSVSLINIIMYPKDNGIIYNEYLNFLLKNYGFAEEFYRWGHGIVADLWTTRWQEMKNITLPIPPYNSQIIINDYLKNKIEKIDLLIRIENQQIDKLKEYKQNKITETIMRGLDRNPKMKDSGFDLIGSIPENWSMCRVKNIGSTQNGISKSGEFFGRGYPFVSYSDVYRNYALPTNVTGLIMSNEKERMNYSVMCGDIFFTRTSETIEEVGFSSVCFKTMPDACFAGFLIRLRPYSVDSLIISNYAKYFFRTNLIRKYLIKEMNLVTRASLSQDLLGTMPVILPSLEEQNNIGHYLDELCDNIDNLTSIKLTKIEKLEEYKKSLIYEYVTGKKEVIA